MALYRKTALVEAVQFIGSNLWAVTTFMEGKEPDTRHPMAAEAWDAYSDRVEREGGFAIRTLEDGPNGVAKHFASIGDWIIKGVQGEHYACKPDIFAATYEPAPELGDQSGSEATDAAEVVDRGPGKQSDRADIAVSEDDTPAQSPAGGEG